MPVETRACWFDWECPDDATLLESPGRACLSKGDLLEAAARIARQLREAGVRRGDVVASVLPNGPEMVSCLLGVPLVATLAPLNPALTKADVAVCLRELGAKAMIAPEGISRLDAPAPDATLEDKAYILLTSGTTARPKQAPLSFANVLAVMDNTARGLGIHSGDSLLGFMPLFHLQGLRSALAQLRAGGRVILMPRFEAAEFRAWISQWQPTWYTAGPTIHRAILRLGPLPRPRGLRLVCSTGARLPPAEFCRLEESLEAPVLESYGLTESGPVCQSPLPPGVRKPGSPGPPFGADVRILPGGEVAIRGPSVISAYRGDDAAHREAFLDGWLRTGDLGHFDEDGYLHLTGRLKEIISRGGEKISPLEVDDALLSHPDVEEVAAFPLPHPSLDEDVAAAVVLRQGSHVDASSLRAAAARVLAPHKRPRRIFLVGSIPKGSTGKPRRRELAAMYAEAQSASGAPSGPLETELARHWAGLLPEASICAETDWYLMGGDSIGLLRLVTEIEGDYGLAPGTLEQTGFLAEPTIRNLARCLLQPRLAAQAVRFHPRGSKTPFFCLPGLYGSTSYMQDFAEALDPDRPAHFLRLPSGGPRNPQTVGEIAARLLGQICELQPQGPYLIGGHCYGGILAWEIAAQMEAAGWVCRGVLVFDAEVPGVANPLRHWRGYAARARDSVAALIRGGGVRAFGKAVDHVYYLAGLYRRRRAALTMLRQPPSAADPFALLAASARQWRPARIRADAAAFLADGEEHRSEVLPDRRAAWREFTAGSFSVEAAPGTHSGMFTGTCGRQLAAMVSAWLDRHGEPPDSAN